MASEKLRNGESSALNAVTRSSDVELSSVTRRLYVPMSVAAPASAQSIEEVDQTALQLDHSAGCRSRGFGRRAERRDDGSGRGEIRLCSSQGPARGRDLMSLLHEPVVRVPFGARPQPCDARAAGQHDAGQHERDEAPTWGPLDRRR